MKRLMQKNRKDIELGVALCDGESSVLQWAIWEKALQSMERKPILLEFQKCPEIGVYFKTRGAVPWKCLCLSTVVKDHVLTSSDVELCTGDI